MQHLASFNEEQTPRRAEQKLPGVPRNAARENTQGKKESGGSLEGESKLWKSERERIEKQWSERGFERRGPGGSQRGDISAGVKAAAPARLGGGPPRSVQRGSLRVTATRR